MVTFRNNNNKEIILEEMTEILSQMVRDKSLIQIFQITIILKSPGRNNHINLKLIENIMMAREALSNGDKILSENYYSMQII